MSRACELCERYALAGAVKCGGRTPRRKRIAESSVRVVSILTSYTGRSGFKSRAGGQLRGFGVFAL